MKDSYNLLKIRTAVVAAVLGAVAGAGVTLAYDPPRVIGILRGEGGDTLRFGNSFCWAGDQNGDGYDDLLVTHQLANQGYNSMIKLYYGGEEISNQPGFVFHGGQNEAFAVSPRYIGKITSENNLYIALGSRVRDDLGRRLLTTHLKIYRGGDDLDSIPEYIISRPGTEMVFLPNFAEVIRPSDFNGDGYDDLLVGVWNEDENEHARLMVYYGGEQLDTLPDWIVHPGISAYYAYGMSVSTGGDVNGDGFDDFILRYNLRFWLFLGGDPMDTVAAIYSENISQQFSPWYIRNFAIVPDVNGDGYDDFVCGRDRSGPDQSGYLLFFGSAEPDLVPDRVLQNNRNVFGNIMHIAGGDVNADEYGDVITISPDGNNGEGELHIYFGSRFMDTTAAINVRTRDFYGYNTGFGMGAVGDYNGDGVKDFVSYVPMERGGNYYGILTLHGGSRDWRVSVKEPVYPAMQPRSIRIKLHPNPFNAELKVRISELQGGECRLRLMDIAGRMVSDKSISFRQQDEVSFVLDTTELPTGIYIVLVLNRLSSGKWQSALAKALLLR